MLRLLKITAGGALAFALLLALATRWPRQEVAAPAETERQVQVPIAIRTDPVVVTKVTLGDSVVQAGRFIQHSTTDPITGFQADGDWVQNLTIYLLNRTYRNIVFVTLNLGFPETGDGHTTPQRTFTLQLGRIPKEAPAGQRPQPPGWRPILFRAHQTLAIHLGDYIERIRSDVEQRIPLAVATKLAVHLSPFFFDNGMEWYAGAYAVPDPDDPGKVRHLDRNYFPGDLDLYWPGRPGWDGQ